MFQWEVDTVEHFTVAYYFDRIEAAGLAMLEALGVPAGGAGAALGCVTTDCYVRYLRELRAGDVLHVQSGVLAAEASTLRIGHRLVNSASGDVCATVEQTVARVDRASRTPVPFPAAVRAAAQARVVDWDGPPRERRPPPRGMEGFQVAARDVIAPHEAGPAGEARLSAYIHRFSAAALQTLAVFGMTPAYQRDERRALSTFEFQAAFVRPVRAGDVVTVHSALLHVGNSSLRIFHRMVGRDGAEAATLDQSGVHLDMDARRPAPLPEPLRGRARAILAPTAA